MSVRPGSSPTITLLSYDADPDGDGPVTVE